MTRGRSGGFTLVEVMIALAIVALTAVILLDRRLEVVRDAGRSRDLRTAWMLASEKVASLELDPSLWNGPGGQSHGDFGEIDPEYARFRWDYLLQRELIEVEDPAALGGQAPAAPARSRELMRLTFAVRAETLDEPVVVEARFPVAEPPPAAQAEEKAGPDAPKEPPK
jgi:prepilin-type N-terminal cleavage/methylation domain-containing protein